MTVYRFITDLHLGTPIAITAPADLLEASVEKIERLNLYYLGDNIDLKRCTPKDYPYYLTAITHIRRNFIDRFVSGNHELTTNAIYKVIDNHILITHGDFAMWGEEKSFAFRRMKPAQGYGLISRVVELFRSGRVSNKDELRLSEFASSHNCDTLVCGHVHVKERFDEKVFGVRVIVLPRGLSEVEI